MGGTKEAIRQDMRRRRRSLSVHQVEDAGRRVACLVDGWELYQRAPAVLLYLASNNELPTNGILESAHRQRKRVLLPRVAGDTLAFAEYRPGDLLRPGAFGIREPTGVDVDLRAERDLLVFVPLLGWDASGARLGRGGGFFDRALGGLGPGVRLAGLGYEFQECVRLPTDPWDVRLHHVVTERGVVDCTRGGGDAPRGKEDRTRHGMDRNDPVGGAAGGTARAVDRAPAPAALRG